MSSFHLDAAIYRQACLIPSHLSAFAEYRERKPVDECTWQTLRSSPRPVEYTPQSRREPPSENLLHRASEGGFFGGFRQRNDGYYECNSVEASFDWRLR